MCAAIHAVTNGLIEYSVYTTLMYTWSLACNMANTNEAPKYIVEQTSATNQVKLVRPRCTTCGSILFDGQIQYCDEICWMEEE